MLCSTPKLLGFEGSLSKTLGSSQQGSDAAHLGRVCCGGPQVIPLNTQQLQAAWGSLGGAHLGPQ